MTALFPEAQTDWHRERETVIAVFSAMLRAPTGDGSTKRQRGEKVPWWRDPGHEPAMFRHIAKWKSGEKLDTDSGCHPLVHTAWRALAIAWQETQGQVPPPEHCKD